jgi:tetratricopeptide (TPR) repeat protein
MAPSSRVSRALPAGAVAAALLAAGTYFLWARPRPAPAARPEAPALSPGASERAFVEEILRLFEERKFREGRERLRGAVERHPEAAGLRFLLGRCLYELGAYEAGLPHWERLLELDPSAEAAARRAIGVGKLRLGRAREALPHLEKAAGGDPADPGLRLLAAEALVDLERYEDALRRLEGLDPPDEQAVRLRYRALVALRKAAEAESMLEAWSPPEARRAQAPAFRAILRAGRLREEGDFAAALGALDAARAGADPESRLGLHLRRSRLAVLLEAGDLAPVIEEGERLGGVADPQIAGDAIAYRVLALLEAGRREEAMGAARDFLGRIDPELGDLRQVRLTMLHLTGERSEEDLEREAREVARAFANDIYYYLAVATGDRRWAERAREATPGRNFPWHSILRRLGG